MSTETLSQRPIFASEEQNLLTPNRPPLSRLAISSFVSGLVSSLALFNLDLVVLPILASALSLAAYLLIFKNDAVRGQSLALWGLALGIVFGVACYTSTIQRDRYLYREGAAVAESFLKVVGQNKLLEAYELTRSEPDRQVAGASLEEAYKNASDPTKEAIDTFQKLESVLRVSNLGPSARWKLNYGVQVLEVRGQSMHVIVNMIEEKSKKTAELTLNRDLFQGIGAWHVVSIR